MSEERAVGRVDGPVTVGTITADLHRLGVGPGDILLVHSSLSALGWVCGGAQAVVEALLLAVGETGTIVMPTHSSQNSDPSFWENPPVPKAWWPMIRESMPAFDPSTTPTRSMGAVVEAFRTHPEARRSAHPELSFAAVGAERDTIVDGHSLNFPMGEDSPLARVYELGGKVLLLGVGHANNTSLHFAEYRAEWSETQVERGAAMIVDGVRAWVIYDDIDTDPSDFEQLGKAYEKQRNDVLVGPVGAGTARLMPQRELVDFAVGWMDRNRDLPDDE